MSEVAFFEMLLFLCLLVSAWLITHPDWKRLLPSWIAGIVAFNGACGLAWLGFQFYHLSRNWLNGEEGVLVLGALVTTIVSVQRLADSSPDRRILQFLLTLILLETMFGFIYIGLKQQHWVVGSS